MAAYELGGASLRHTSRRHGEVVLLLRAAMTSEWASWRKSEAQRERRRSEEHVARLKAAGLSEAELLQAREQVRAYAAAGEERAHAMIALAERAEAGEDVAQERDALEHRSEAELEAQALWVKAVNTAAAYRNAHIEGEVIEGFDEVRHSFDLVLGCIVRIEGAALPGGAALIWDDAQLAHAGWSKTRVLETILGGGEGAIVELYTLVDLVCAGLTERQKKA